MRPSASFRYPPGTIMTSSMAAPTATSREIWAAVQPRWTPHSATRIGWPTRAVASVMMATPASPTARQRTPWASSSSVRAARLRAVWASKALLSRLTKSSPVAARAQRAANANTDHRGHASSRAAPQSGPTRLPARIVPPSAVIAWPRWCSGTVSATTACRARFQAVITGARSTTDPMNRASDHGCPDASATMPSEIVSTAAPVAKAMAVRSPTLSMNSPTGTVNARAVAPMMPTMAAASACEAPSSSAASTSTGAMAPIATPSRKDGARTGQKINRYTHTPLYLGIKIPAARTGRHPLSSPFHPVWRTTPTATGPRTPWRPTSRSLRPSPCGDRMAG